MFTGLVEKVSRVNAVRKNAESMTLSVDLGELAKQLKAGDSVAINGACLTVSRLQAANATFDVGAETLKKTTLDRLSSASLVNVELALKADDRFGGHFVQGHIDGTATIKAVDKKQRFWDITFSAPPELLSQMVVKGSVAVDGISLTINDINKAGFRVAIIPQTLEKTTLSNARVGNKVNIETDLIVKTVKRHLDSIFPQSRNLTAEKLEELGF